jgi:hypothetical protein
MIIPKISIDSTFKNGWLDLLNILVAFLHKFFRSINVSIIVVVSQGIWKVLQ